MPFLPKKIWCRNLSFVVWESVYEPAEDTFLFSEYIDASTGMAVLDIGTGCGILGILAAKKAKVVVALDINPNAIRCAIENAQLCKVDKKMFFIQGDLLSPISIRQHFDRILFNAPYLPTDPGESVSWLARAWDGGITGREVIDRFIHSAHKYLKDGGKIFLMQSTLVEVDRTIETFAEVNMKADIVAKLNLPFFETLLLLKAQRDK